MLPSPAMRLRQEWLNRLRDIELHFCSSLCPQLALRWVGLAVYVLFLDSWTLRIGPIGCPEKTVWNYHYSLRNNPEECSSPLSEPRLHHHPSKKQAVLATETEVLVTLKDIQGSAGDSMITKSRVVWQNMFRSLAETKLYFLQKSTSNTTLVHDM
jgi:hypothetical protein